MEFINVIDNISGWKAWNNQDMQILEVTLCTNTGKLIKHITADVSIHEDGLHGVLSYGTQLNQSLFLREMVTKALEHGLLKECKLPLIKLQFMKLQSTDDIYSIKPQTVKT